MKLRKPTQWIRRTVDQTGRIILVPEQVEDPRCPTEMVRRVILLSPTAPKIAVALGPQPCELAPAPEFLDDPEGYIKYENRIRHLGGIPGVDDIGSTPEDIASGRVYAWPQPPQGKPVKFHLMANQWMSAAAVEEIAEISVLVEYIA